MIFYNFLRFYKEYLPEPIIVYFSFSKGITA